MVAYFISGIGADARLFRHIELPPQFEPKHISWIEPLAKESIPQYALRLASQINRNHPHILIGLSLGGIMAVEIAQITHPILTILISSVPKASCLPPYFRWAAWLGIEKVFPPGLFKLTATCKHLLLLKSKDDKKVMLSVIRNGNNQFIRWAIHAVLQWKNETAPTNIFHIHGSKDEVFPIRYCNPNIIIDGGHMLVMSKAIEINSYLSSRLNRI